jgi:hypothetical protein
MLAWRGSPSRTCYVALLLLAHVLTRPASLPTTASCTRCLVRMWGAGVQGLEEAEREQLRGEDLSLCLGPSRFVGCLVACEWSRRTASCAHTGLTARHVRTLNVSGRRKTVLACMPGLQLSQATTLSSRTRSSCLLTCHKCARLGLLVCQALVGLVHAAARRPFLSRTI